ncbi:hypothetical protein ACLB2K_010065 [Fragaria x ananassa]
MVKNQFRCLKEVILQNFSPISTPRRSSRSASKIRGEVAAVNFLAPKIGYLGLSSKQIGEDIAKETAKDLEGQGLVVSVVPSAAPPPPLSWRFVLRSVGTYGVLGVLNKVVKKIIWKPRFGRLTQKHRKALVLSSN